jgi:predicted nucleotidyltransferase
MTPMERQQLIRKLVRLRPALGAEGVEHMALFGSRSRGDHRSNSDVDLLVEVAEGAAFSLLNLVGVEQIVSRETGVRTNAMMRRSLDQNFREAIRDDIVELF